MNILRNRSNKAKDNIEDSNKKNRTYRVAIGESHKKIEVENKPKQLYDIPVIRHTTVCSTTNSGMSNSDKDKKESLKGIEKINRKKIKEEQRLLKNAEKIEQKSKKKEDKKKEKTKRKEKKTDKNEKEEAIVQKCNELGLKVIEDTDKKKKLTVTKRINAKINAMKQRAALNKQKALLIASWNRIMAQTSKYNNDYDTFEIVGEEKTGYGWKFKLYAPDGLSFNELTTLRPVIENNMGCTFIYEIASSNEYATCTIVYEKLVKCNKIPFVPVKVKPYEVCPGVKITGEPMIIDSIAAPHILLAGGTRRGKNGATDSIILSWINSCTEKEIELYLFQCAKVDLVKYENCKQVKACVLQDFDKMLEILEYLVNVEMKNRLDLFKDMFRKRAGENIFDYNELNPDNQLPYVYVILDEFLELMMQSNNKVDKEINDTKNQILTNIQRIGQMGAAVGIQYIVIHQKPEKALCPTFIKNMSNIRICFGFEDESCGRIVLGDRDGGLVLNLPARRAYVNNNGNLELIYTTNLGDGRRDMFIRPNEVEKMGDIFTELKDEHMPKPVEKDIKEVDGDETENRTVKQDTGTAPLPDNKKAKKIELKEDEVPKSESENNKIETKEKEIEHKNEIVEVVSEKQDIAVEEVENKGLPSIQFKIVADENGVKIEKTDNSNTQKYAVCNKEEVMESTSKLEDTKEVIEDKQEVIEDKAKINEDKTEINEDKTEINEDKTEINEDKEEVSKNSAEIKEFSVESISKKQGRKETDLASIDNDTILNIQAEIEDIVASNAKKNPNWVPWEPKDGDKVVNLDTIKVAKFYNRKAK